MRLFYRTFGSGKPLIIVHGLMGSSDNWVALARQYAKEYHVFIPDQRNHGQSFHSDEFNYDLLRDDLAQFVDEVTGEPVSLMGHSLGGKVVMHYTLKHPDRVKQLIVADMAPKVYQVDFADVFSALNAVDLENLTSRSEAEKIVGRYIPDFGMKQFLLKNLARVGDKYVWKANIQSIQANIKEVGTWKAMGNPFNGPALFIAGEKSGYVKTADKNTIKAIFPNAQFEFINAGHWLHAEKPNEFIAATLRFLHSPLLL